jgi:HSP20 family protein
MSDHNPFEGVTDLFTELSRMREVGLHGRETAHEDKQRTHASAWVPTTDIFAQGDRLVIRIELAGVDPQDVDLHFANGVLTVSGTRNGDFGTGAGDTGEEPKFYVRERFYGAFRRSVTLPEGTQRSQIQAGFDDGLVEIVISGVSGRSDATRIELRDRSSAATTRAVE